MNRCVLAKIAESAFGAERKATMNAFVYVVSILRGWKQWTKMSMTNI